MAKISYEKYDPKDEAKILSFWQQKQILDSIIIRNKSGKPFYFLQGPPYTSGRIHCGQAWNHALKDMVLRYKRMNGFDVLARAGYDMHGLPTAHKVQKKFNLESKEDIDSFGKDKFVKECIAWSEEKAQVMNEDLANLGTTLDFSDPYHPISAEYIDSVWHLIKKADEKKRLYLGEKTMSWCSSCATALAKHEQEYKEVKDNSIFLKFQTADKEDEYFVIWTTTPWTIPFNLAIMVNPEMEYVKAKVTYKDDCPSGKKGQTEYWYVCKDLAGIFLSNVDEIEYKIEEEFLGETLEGKHYIHPWAKETQDMAEMQKASPNIFSVLLSSEFVDSSAGTGLVHCAPGCGPEDYEVGIRNGIPPYNTLNEKGIFPDKLAKVAGWRAKTDDLEFVKLMKAEGFLIKKSPIEHDYAHCERCHNPIIFRTTKQWFFKTEDLKKRMIELNKDVNWHPQTAKNAFDSWLDNLRDNSITKQRIWGTPAPIWVHLDDEGNVDEYYVVSSLEELKTLSGQDLENPHRPWVDDIVFKHPKTGTELKRIPDILDVWIDAGCASWASLYYPQKTEAFEKYFPADFIVEGKDQIRGWFNLLMVASILAFDKVPFKNVVMHGFISDVDGEKMSKSLGNIIQPHEVIEKSSTDNFRYYFSQTKAGEDIAFSWEQLDLHQRHLSILWNVSKYAFDLLDHYKGDLSQVLDLGKKNLGLEEKYMLSKTHAAIKSITASFESYKLDEIASQVAELFLSMSRNYIQAIRDKVNGDESAQASVIYTLVKSLHASLTLFSPIAPFITETIYQNAKAYDVFDFKNESVHQEFWPKCDESIINADLEAEFEIALDVISGILAAREKAGQNVRQPLAKAVVVTKKKLSLDAINLFSDMICTQTNIKEIDGVEIFDALVYGVKANFKELGSSFGQKTAEIGTAINALSKTDANHMHALFEESKVFELSGVTTLEGGPVEIKQHHVNFDISVADPFAHAKTSRGIVAIDTTLTPELLNEGLSRELTRRIQQERKDLGLIKSDRATVVIDNKELFDKIKPYLDTMTQVCGIEEFTCSDSISGNSYDVKGETFQLVVKKL
jgi:isoleucyl-tRNA synthetase